MIKAAWANRYPFFVTSVFEHPGQKPFQTNIIPCVTEDLTDLAFVLYVRFVESGKADKPNHISLEKKSGAEGFFDDALTYLFFNTNVET